MLHGTSEHSLDSAESPCSWTLLPVNSCDIKDGSKDTNEDEGIDTLHRSVSNDPHVPQIATAVNWAT